ncbi:hypothetical protein UCREL1_9814 [Eutypa lata UCREL1]|uniref:DUF7580 domain-containing protein n=1 Tax=Eutypa lata (strain UCR-EL1) TaxID=1287681 RepID=M7SAQ0_EUTLA|nr:hypothetical protein UCREL1_9814 [Eutypa lata UCREL1]
MAELALAIVPLCATAIQGAAFIRKRLKILRHHDKEIKRLRKKFISQTDIFLDECQLLLQEILEPEVAAELIEDPSHPDWLSPRLDEKIKVYLGRKYDDFKATVEEIQGYIAALSNYLDTSGKGDTSKVDVKLKRPERVQEGIGIMLHKPKFESSIDGFKDANQELKRLRKTAAKIQRSQSKPSHPVEKSISISQQVRLALNLVQGVLKFHSTPWLRPYWRLQDLSYFEATEGLAASLSTLHIGTELSPRQQCDSLMTDATGDVLDAQLACGIRNLTMHSLGVALLQIGQWDPLKPDDIVEVRKVADIAERDSRLGPRYQKITQQCLDCDFGLGKDLTQMELQNAICKY